MPTRRFSSSPADLPRSSSPARPKNPPLNLSAAAPSSPSLPFVFMGQGPSRSTSPAIPDPPPSVSVASKGFQAAVAGGSRIRRAFVGRRKISEDVSYLFGFGNKREPVQEQQLRVEPCVPLTSSLSLPAAKANLAGKRPSNFSNPTLFPPPPPPKSRPSHHQEVTQVSSSLTLEQVPATPDTRSSIIPLSPGITNALTLMVLNEKEQSISKLNLDAGQDLLPKPKPRDADTARWEGAAAADIKEARRKSDSTMSYHTIRPGTTSNRTSRPVSMAESLQSNHTVKPVRISALISDADFTMLEEDDDDTTQDAVILPIPPVIKSLPPEASLKTKSRRSLSFNLGPYSSLKKQPPPPPPSHHPTLSLAEIKYPSYSVTEGMPPFISPPTPSTAKEVPKTIHTSTPGQTGPVASPRLLVGQNLRGKLSSWTNPSPFERKLPGLPPQPQRPGLLPMPSSQPLHIPRAISMTSNLAPAAGRALRGAVGRMGRVIGIHHTSSNSTSTSGSSPTTSDPHNLTRTNSNHSSSASQSSSANHSYSPMAWGRRRTPDASSGSWPSVTSTSVSDMDHLGVPSGPILGLMLRAPFQGSGVVFGNELELAVKDTAVGTTPSSGEGRRAGEWERMDLMKKSKMRDAEKAIEERRLPAVVVRCAQHILTWGIEEEGIFRVPGRSKHVSTLRSEFDKGADYDLASCEPGDLDPHAVASVFKAYFRELPEHMLTQVLLPYFEGIVERETAAASAATESKSDVNHASRGLGLPFGPKAGNLPPALKKPPSLSTLAMPSFKDIPPPSNSLIRAIRALISQLPEENRDLLRTLVDIISATAKNEKATKMPLANLVLVFYPTVQMTPPLLRILCETKDIWDGESETTVVDVKKEDAGEYASSSPGIFSEGHDGAVGRESHCGAWTSEDHNSSLASGGDSINLNEDFVRRRPLARPRRNPETIYLDAECRCSSASLLLHGSPCAADSSRDNASLSSNKSPNARSPSSTPPMTSSVESLVTPGTSSQPSLPHLPMNGNEKHETEEDVESMSGGVAPESTQYILPGPVQFPSLPSSLPSSPLKRRSTPILSLPHIVPSSVYEPPSPTSSSHSNSSLSRRLKLKKPSLQLFLSSKRSNSSLRGISKLNISSPVLNNDSLHSASDSSVSTPQSTVTAPQESTQTPPPVVGTPFESSPLGLGTGIEVTPSNMTLDNQCEEDVEEVSTAEAIKTATPIADRNGGDSTSSSMLSIAVSTRSVPEPNKKTPLRSIHRRPATSVSSNHLGILDQELDSGDEWTHSVLLAADISHDRGQDQRR
ncbi:hypothetical protein APHAL10511_003773 [Amanita phalloides]|nr:hypothetical protein APHAL10511_003773 [Amanita phalloides]